MAAWTSGLHEDAFARIVKLRVSLVHPRWNNVGLLLFYQHGFDLGVCTVKEQPVPRSLIKLRCTCCSLQVQTLKARPFW